MGTPAPDALLRLVDRFDQDRKVFLSGDYKEEQLRAEFLNPFFIALGWDMDNTLDTIPVRNWGSVPPSSPSAGRRPTYKQMLRRHRVRLTGRSTIEEQSARHHAGTRHAKDIGFRLRGLLDARRVPTDRFTDYFAFAQSLGSCARRYTAISLQIQAANLIDQWETESLDRNTLLAIAVVLFGVNVST
jgi:hypothetical protein